MEYLKYPKTYHLPWSGGVQSDDKIIPELGCFEGREVVVSEKLDGENTNMYRKYMHARSIDSAFNFTRSWATNMHATICQQIPDDIHLSGENMWGAHSLPYPDGVLEGYFYLFSVWKHSGSDVICLSYEDTTDWANKLDLPMPKVLYRGVFDEKKLKEIAKSVNTDICEGYVVRLTDSFYRNDMKTSVAKFVRKGHVQPNSDHWLKNVKQNGKLKSPCKPYFMEKTK